MFSKDAKRAWAVGRASAKKNKKKERMFSDTVVFACGVMSGSESNT